MLRSADRRSQPLGLGYSSSPNSSSAATTLAANTGVSEYPAKSPKSSKSSSSRRPSSPPPLLSPREQQQRYSHRQEDQNQKQEPPPRTPPNLALRGKSIDENRPSPPSSSSSSATSRFLRPQPTPTTPQQEWSSPLTGLRSNSNSYRRRSEGTSGAAASASSSTTINSFNIIPGGDRKRYSQQKTLRKNAAGPQMENSRAAALSVSSASSKSTGSKDDAQSGSGHHHQQRYSQGQHHHQQPGVSSGPFVLRYGRRYLLNASYPLPVDLPELHRENLHTLLATEAFARSLCSPLAEKNPPRSVLEVACGSGYWSAQCHDYLAELGCLNVSFTGIDIAPLAPDFASRGINWRFVQHDITRFPFPFEAGSFDLIVLKDLTLVLQVGSPLQRLLDECVRLLRSGGVLEIWETDYIIRSLTPHPPPPPGKGAEEHRQALLSGTFLISPATPFGPAKNHYLQDYNRWIQQALDRRKLSPSPCARMLPMLLQEPDALCEVGGRRIAIPFGEMRWEQDDKMLTAGRELAAASIGAERPEKDSLLTDEQLSVRTTALQVLVQFVESMEPLLKEVNGKNHEEWRRWYGALLNDLFQKDGASSGDCLELGIYWARKK